MRKSAHRALIQAAIDLGCRNYGPPTVRELAEHAKVTPAAINYHFRSKEALQREAWIYCVKQVSAPLEGLKSDASAYTAISMLCQRIIGLSKDRPELLRFILRENLDSESMDPQIAQELYGNPHSSWSQFAKVIRVAIIRGEIRQIDPYHLLLYILGAILFPFQIRQTAAAVIPHFRGNPETFCDSHARFVITSVESILNPNFAVEPSVF